MSAIDKVREKWQRAKLRLSVRRRFGRWGLPSPVRHVELADKGELLQYDDLQELRFLKAKEAAGAQIGQFQQNQAQYPQASNPRHMAQIGFRRNSIVRACTDLLCRAATAAEVRVETSDGKPASDPMAAQIQRFLDYPSGIDMTGSRAHVGPITWGDLYWRFVQDLLGSGSGMLEWVDSTNDPAPVQLWRMDPELTYIVPGKEQYIETYVVEVDGFPFKVPLERVVHMRFWDPLDPYFGIPPHYSALRDLVTDNRLTDFTSVTLQNLGVPPAAIEYDFKDMAAGNFTLDPHSNATDRESIVALRDQFADMYSGANRGKMAIAFGFKIKLLGMSMKDLEASSLVRVSESRIATAFGVPMVLLNRSSPEPDKPGAVYRQGMEQFYRDNVTSLVRRIEEVFSPRIVGAFDPLMRYRIKFDLSGVDVLREQKLKRAREAGAVFQTSIVGRHTAQRLAGLELEGEDEFAPLSTASEPLRLPGDQGEDVAI